MRLISYTLGIVSGAYVVGRNSAAYVPYRLTNSSSCGTILGTMNNDKSTTDAVEAARAMVAASSGSPALERAARDILKAVTEAAAKEEPKG